MYNTAYLKPFKLKTTNGNLLAYYGNCKINMPGLEFSNIKQRNKTDRPFDIGRSFYLNNKSILTKISTTTHVMALNKSDFNSQLSRLELTSNNINYNNGVVQSIPNTNDTVTFNAINNLINSIKNKPLRKTLQTLFYNITHGNTPYSNINYQNETIENNFALIAGDSDEFFNMFENHYPTGANNYPQNAIILLPQDYEDNGLSSHFFFYQQNNPCKFFYNNEYRTMPNYGIALSDYDVAYFYWTTYKGV